MSALLLVLVLGPSIAALLAALLEDRAPQVGTAAAVLAGIGWAVVAAADAPVEAAELSADPVLAAAAVGLCALVAAARSRSTFGVAAGLLVLTVVPGAAALDPSRVPDRRLAAGVLLAAVLAAARLLLERGPRLGQVVVLIAGAVLGAGLVGEDPGDGLALAAAGTLVAVVAAATWGPTGRLLVPIGLLVVARASAGRPGDPDLDVALLVVAGLVAFGAGVLALGRSRPVVERLPLGAALAAAGLLALDVPELRGAGALLAAGAVLALAGRHPIALVALAPGIATAVHDAGLATEGEHAAIGAAAVVALAAGLVGRTRAPAQRPTPFVLPALGFAVVPLWGWSGATTDVYGEGVAIAAAVGIPLLVLAAALPALRQTADLARGTGRIDGRPRAVPSHGPAPRPASEAEALHREEAGTEAP